MKRGRQNEILTIIKEKDVETQEQLLMELSQRGYTATQATISRDIKELHLVKELARGGYRYATPDRRSDGSMASRLQNILKESIVSVAVAQNIVVLRTMPGLASGACSALDSMDIIGMVGSLAGDDTAILIMGDHGQAKVFEHEMKKLMA